MDISWQCCKLHTDNRQVLEDILPRNYKYVVKSHNVIEKAQIDIESKFESTLLVNVCTEEGLKTFLEDFTFMTYTSYNQEKGGKDQKNLKTVKWSGKRKCIHNVSKQEKPDGSQRKDKVPNKNTSCEAYLKFKLVNCQDHEHSEECSLYSLQLELSYQHNHSIKSGSAVQFQHVAEDVRLRFHELFSQGYSASQAYAAHRRDVEKRHGSEEDLYYSANSTLIPSYRWVFYQKNIFMNQNFGPVNSPATYRMAEEKVQQYNHKYNQELAKIRQKENGQYYVICCEPMSRRAHEMLPASGDIVLIDSTSSLDNHDSKFFRLLCSSPIGGIPLGWVLISHESESLLTEAFTLFRETLPQSAFFKRGPVKGPRLFLSDDATSEHNMLRNVWPDSQVLLCVWHVQQALWRYLWSRDHNVAKEDRKHLFKLFRSLVYAKSRRNFDSFVEKLRQDDIAENYPDFIQHVENNYLSRPEMWAMYHRIESELPTNSVTTNNMLENPFRILKENVFSRTKVNIYFEGKCLKIIIFILLQAYNIPSLLEILFEESSIHYRRKLIDVGNSRYGTLSQSKSTYQNTKTSITSDKILEVGEGCFLVESETRENEMYLIDMKNNHCQCIQGRMKGNCKHKIAIMKHYNCAEMSVLPVNDSSSRSIYHYIAYGITLPAEWYRPLKKPDETENINKYLQERQAETSDVTDQQEDNEAVDNEDADNEVDHDEEDAEEDDYEEDAEAENETSQQEFNDLWALFQNAQRKFEQKLRMNLESKDFTKCFRKFVKNIDQVTSTQNPERFKRKLFEFGQDLGTVGKNGGRKRKTSSQIPVQATAKARRVQSQAGKSSAKYGRKHKQHTQQTQLQVYSDDEIVYHSFPSQNTRKRRRHHSLSSAVEENRQNPKKHIN